MSLTHRHVGECSWLPATLSSSLLACCSVSSVWNDIWLNYAVMSSRRLIKGNRTHARCFPSRGRLIKLWLMSKGKINEVSGQRGVLTSCVQPVHLLYISVYRCQGWVGGGCSEGSLSTGSDAFVRCLGTDLYPPRLCSRLLLIIFCVSCPVCASYSLSFLTSNKTSTLCSPEPVPVASLCVPSLFCVCVFAFITEWADTINDDLSVPTRKLQFLLII